jgi:hypothetical protein
MLRRLRPRLTFANVCSVLALFIALSTGTAYAANTVFSHDIVDGEVKRPDIRNNAVNDAKVEDGSLLGTDLTFETITNAQIATDAVQATEIADNSIDGGEVVDGGLSALDLAVDAVGASEIASSAVGSSEILDGSVGTAEVATNSLTTADLLGADISGNISLTANAVANGRCEDIGVSVNGAQVGQAVLFTLKEAVPQGVYLTGTRVPSANIVTMKYCNFTGGTFPALTDIAVRVITFG